MNIQTIIKMLTDSGIEEAEAKREVSMLLEHFCEFTEEDKIRGNLPEEGDLKLLEEKALERIETRNPVQYITGRAWFMGEYFKVTPDVLIPRDETEILVREAIEIIKRENIENVLDIGTGSGCIACTVAKQTKAVVLGTDISSDALRVALDNVTSLGINNRAIFRKSDIFSKIREEERFGLIVSNPPYIPVGTELQEEVRHEPEIALFAEDNGLAVYKRIIQEAPRYLKKGGYLMFELGIDEADVVKELMENSFENIYTIKDLAGIERVVCGQLK